MQNTNVCEAFRQYYLKVLKESHTNKTLIERWGSDPSRLETQIMCHKHGTRVPDSNMYEDEGEVFGPQRWPYNAATEPSYSNPPIKYIIANRLKCIGTTWWDWKAKHTLGLGFDIDSLVGHAAGLSDSDISKWDEIDVPWLEVIKSTRGSGRHLYIWFQEPFPVTLTHTEHAALARSFIPLIARHTGYDLSSDVDVCGGVMWIHHTEATADGYKLIKPVKQLLTAEHVPPTWRQHLEVVSGSRSKVRVQGWTPTGDTSGDELDEMTESCSRIQLDETHLKILDALEGTGHTSVWVHDHHLWQGHTAGLKQVYDEWEEAGHPLKGLFDTNSLGSDAGKPNCFMRPLLNGAWDVYRFGEGTEEHELWDAVGRWTHIKYNAAPSLRQVATACGGFESPDPKQGYIFNDLQELIECLKMLQVRASIPRKAEDRTLSLYRRKDGKLVLTISKERGDRPQDFGKYAKTPKGWSCVLTPGEELIEEGEQIDELDSKFRALKICEIDGGAFTSWVLRDLSGGWTTHPKDNIKCYLASLGFQACDPLIGEAVYNAWEVVNEPFQPEYPGDRKWNRWAAQFKYPQAKLREGEFPKHPNWDLVFSHCGADLDPYVSKLKWCKAWGIETGGDYLKAWVACMFQQPYCKLPYLFMYGPQNSGKSIFHEAIRLLLTKGVVGADRALTSVSGYNGELQNAILGVVDEVDINKAGSQAYNKLKEWVTGQTISIHAKYQQVKEHKSTLHFCQMANSRASLPVFPGDTRITAMFVGPLENEIPKEILIESLKAEAPMLMADLLNMELQPAQGRLLLPIIETQGKTDAAQNNMSELDAFIDEHCYAVDGQYIILKDLKEQFHKTLDTHQRAEWSLGTIKQQLSERYPIGMRRGRRTAIGNLSWEIGGNGVKLVKKGGKLVKEGEDE